MKKKMTLRARWATVAALAAWLTAAPALAQSAAIPVVDEIGTAKFRAYPGDAPGPTTRTIPYWTFAGSDPTNGVTYPLSMVGGDPSRRNTTVVDSEIVPLRIRFAWVVTLDGTDRVNAVVASPIYSSYAYSADMAGGAKGQYGDIFMRAQFNALDTGYHVLLGAPAVLLTVTIDVPKNQGSVFLNSRGVLIGLVDIVWFSSRLRA